MTKNLQKFSHSIAAAAALFQIRSIDWHHHQQKNHLFQKSSTNKKNTARQTSAFVSVYLALISTKKTNARSINKSSTTTSASSSESENERRTWDLIFSGASVLIHPIMPSNAIRIKQDTKRLRKGIPALRVGACERERERERQTERQRVWTFSRTTSRSGFFVLKLKIKARHKGLIEVAAGGQQAISHLSSLVIFAGKEPLAMMRLLENGINCQDWAEKFKDISKKMKSLLKMLLKLGWHNMARRPAASDPSDFGIKILSESVCRLERRNSSFCFQTFSVCFLM